MFVRTLVRLLTCVSARSISSCFAAATVAVLALHFFRLCVLCIADIRIMRYFPNVSFAPLIITRMWTHGRGAFVCPSVYWNVAVLNFVFKNSLHKAFRALTHELCALALYVLTKCVFVKTISLYSSVDWRNYRRWSNVSRRE